MMKLKSRENEPRDERRETRMVRDGLRYLPHTESSPDFDDRVLEAIRVAPPQHVWSERAPTRREQWRLRLAQRALQIEKLFSLDSKVFGLLCATVFAFLFVLVLQFAWSHANHAPQLRNGNAPDQMQARDSVRLSNP